MRKKHKYITWDQVTGADIPKLSEEELKKREEAYKEERRKENILIDLLVEHFDDLFRKDGYYNGEPIYIYEYASDWSDSPHLEIRFDDWYDSMPQGYWDFFRRGANGGNTYDSPQAAFRGYLEDGNWGIWDLDRDSIGYTDEINEIIESGELY